MVWAQLALNKQSNSVFMGYARAIDLYGRPMRVRADMAFEAQGIGQDMLDHRGPGSYLTGPSTQNQRIENYWNFVWAHWAYYYKGQFQVLENFRVLDRFNKGDLHSLIAAYFDFLQARLTEVCEMWNNHTVRPQSRYGISAYKPCKRFIDGVAAFRGMPLEEVAKLHSSLDTIDLIMFEDAPHNWTRANDQEESHLATEVACDLLELPEHQLLRDEVYRSMMTEDPRRNYMYHRLVTHQVLNMAVWLAAGPQDSPDYPDGPISRVRELIYETAESQGA